MEAQKIKKRFSLIYKVVNILFYMYVLFAFSLIILIPVVFYSSDFSVFFYKFIENFNNFWNSLKILFVFIFWFLFFLAIFLNLFLLYYIRKLAFRLKSWEIFTQENLKMIRNLFWFFAILFIITWIIFSWGMFSFIIWIFIWILYEIFFIWFDYKLQNEILQEENKLTI